MTKNNKSGLSIYYFILVILMIGLIPVTKTIGYQNTQSNSLLETNNEITRGGSSIFANGNYVYIIEGYSGFQIYDVSIKDEPVRVDSYSEYGNYFHNMIVQNDYVYFYNPAKYKFNILDCSNVSDIKLEGNLTLPDGNYREFAVIGRNLYAITATEFSIFNFTDYTNISLVDSYTNVNASFSDITIKGNYSYILDSGYGLAIFNITNPSDIQKVNELVIDDNSTFIEFFITDDYLYIQEGFTMLYFYDITNHLDITYITKYNITTNHFNDLFVTENYVFALYRRSFDIIDISNLADIKTIGNYEYKYTAIFEDIYVEGNFAYITSSQSGELEGYRPLYIVDITTLDSPVLIFPDSNPHRFLDTIFITIGAILGGIVLITVISLIVILARKKKEVPIDGKM